MGDSINIDGSLLQQQPSPFNAFMQGAATARAMNLLKQQDAARNAALADPSNLDAVTRFAVFNPDAAKPLQQRILGNAAANALTANAFAAPTVASPAPGTPTGQSSFAPSGLPAVQPGSSFAQAFAPVAQGQLANSAPVAAQVPPDQLVNAQAPHMQALGAAASNGQMDSTKALAALAQVGGPEAVSSMVQSLGQMDTLRRTRLADMNNALGTVAQTLLNTPQSQRAAVLTQAAPYLAQHGVTTDQINQAISGGLTDQQLHGFVGQAVGVKGLIDQANKEREFGQTDRQLGQGDQRIAIERGQLAETIRRDNMDMSRGVMTPTGEIVNPITGKMVYNPDQPQGDTFTRMIGAESGGNQFAANGQPITSGKGAVGIAQVMPGTAPEAAKLAGLPWDPQRYKTDAAYNAQIGRAYFDSLVQRFGGDETKAVAAYNGGMGRVQSAVAQYGDQWLQHMPAETQGYVGKVMTGGGSSVDGQAKAIAEGNAPALTGRAAATGIGARIMRRVYEMNPEYDAKNYNPQVASLKSFTSGKDSQTVQALNNVAQHIHTLDLLGEQLRNGNMQMFNRIAQGWAQATGQAAPTNFDAAKQIIGGEIVKAIAGAGGGQGDRQEAADILSRVNSPAQLHGALVTIRDLVGSQVNTLQNKYEQGTGRKDFSRFLMPAAKSLFGGGQSLPMTSTGKLVLGKDGVMEYHP